MEVIQNLYGEIRLEGKEVIHTPFWMDNLIMDERFMQSIFSILTLDDPYG